MGVTMFRLIFQLLGLVAVLLAAAPASAAVFAQPASAAGVEAEHCANETATAQHDEGDSQPGEAEHPCCVSSMGGCCPLAAAFGRLNFSRPHELTGGAHHVGSDGITAGAEVSPNTEPPIFA